MFKIKYNNGFSDLLAVKNLINRSSRNDMMSFIKAGFQLLQNVTFYEDIYNNVDFNHIDKKLLNNIFNSLNKSIREAAIDTFGELNK